MTIWGSSQDATEVSYEAHLLSAFSGEGRYLSMEEHEPAKEEPRFDDSKKLQALVNLYRYARGRFQELESVGWKFNYSIWGFLAGVGYMFKLKGVRVDGWLQAAFITPVLIHWLLLWRIHINQRGWRTIATSYLNEAERLISFRAPRPGEKDISKTDNIWALCEIAVTAMIAAAVLFFVR
jgi:hypothetical protein